MDKASTSHTEGRKLSAKLLLGNKKTYSDWYQKVSRREKKLVGKMNNEAETYIESRACAIITG